MLTRGGSPWRPRGMWVFPGQEIDPEVLALFERPKGFRHLPRRWVGGAHPGLDRPLPAYEQG
jgi:hypothetical protein